MACAREIVRGGMSAGMLGAAALMACAGAARGQSISFDNECGNNQWYFCASSGGDPDHCVNYNNWDVGWLYCTTNNCPRSPGPSDDVSLGNFYVQVNYLPSTIHDLTTSGALYNTHLVDVTGSALYGGPVTGYGSFGGTGSHSFTGTVTCGNGLSVEYPSVGFFHGNLDIPDGMSFGVYGSAYNTGVTTWRSASGWSFTIDGAYGGGTNCVFHNQQGGLFLATGDAQMRGIIGLGHFENSGTFRKDGGLGTTQIDSEFKNTATGLLDVRTGRLAFHGDSTMQGAAQIAANATLETRGMCVVPTSFNVTGSGTFRVSYALDIAGGAAATVANANMGFVSGEVGRRYGAGALNLTTTAVLPGQYIGGGVTTVMPGCQATMNLDMLMDDTNTRLNNQGVLVWEYGTLGIGGTCSINNRGGGVLDCTGNNGECGGYAFTTGFVTNAGTIRKSAGLLNRFALDFYNTGTIRCETGQLGFTRFHQTAGATVLAGGILTADYQVEPLRFEGGSLRGSGEIRGNVLNSGATVAPGNSAGRIFIGNGIYGNSYTQDAGGTLEIEIGGTVAGTGYDVLATTGGAYLDGTLRVALIDGFSPADGATFDVLTSASRTGLFASENLPAGFSVEYLSTGVRLHFTAGCVADFDDGSGTGTRDGGVTIDDLLYYLLLFAQGDVAADVDDGSGTGTHDDGVTIDDLLYFLVRFAQGC